VLDSFLTYFRRQASPSEELFRFCYLSAYDALPSALMSDSEAFFRTYYPAAQPALAWYTQMCLLTGASFDPFSAATLHWHKGRLPSGREYMVLEYPKPNPVALTVEEFEKGKRGDLGGHWLGPYYSAMLRATAAKPASCFALGQSPIKGITTLRRCTIAAHYNLGYGPDPQLESFLEILSQLESMPPKGCTVRHRDHLSELDRELSLTLELHS